MLLKGAPTSVVPQQLVSQALHDKDRLKAESFRAMCYYIHIMYNNELENEAVDETDRRHIMKRCVCSVNFIITYFYNFVLFFVVVYCSIFFPAAVKTLCLSTAKPEVRTAAADAMRSIQDRVNEYIVEWTQQPLQQNEIKRILG